MLEKLVSLTDWLNGNLSLILKSVVPFIVAAKPWLAPLHVGIALLGYLGVKIGTRDRSQSDRISERRAGPKEIIHGGVKIAGGIATAVGLWSILGGQVDENEDVEGEEDGEELPKRSLGDIPFNASILGSGGNCVVNGTEAEGIGILETCFQLGINYYDTATQYGDGESERRHGIWLRKLASEGKRDEVFIATKTLSRSYEEAKVEIEESFARLGVEKIDLLQLHAINDMGTWSQVSDPNGALRAVEEAKAAGRVKHIGITNHRDPEVLITTINEYPFESVLITLGITDRLKRSFAEEAVPFCVAKGISVVAMKVFAAGKLAQTEADLEKCLHYSYSLPISTAVIGMSSVSQVIENVAWTKTFVPMTEDSKAELAEGVGEMIDVGTLWWKR